MELRPSAARWFEIVVPRADAGDTVEALARRGGIQFEWTGAHGEGGEIEPLQEPIDRYRELGAEFAGLWPAPAFTKRCCDLPVEQSALAALRQIERWHAAGAPLIEALAEARREREDLALWRTLLAALADSLLDLPALAAAGPALGTFCLILPQGVGLPDAEAALLAGPVSLGDDTRAWLGVTGADRLTSLCARVRSVGGRCLTLPDWLEGDPAAARTRLPARLTELDRRILRLEQDLRALAEERGVGHARGVLERIDWFRRTAQDIHCEGDYCWISGWTGERDGTALERALEDVGIASAVAFLDPPVDAPSPSVSRNPAWLRPFEVFTEAIGVPGPREADPTTWVALMVPLLFGYMCGDVGHGAVIAAAGLLLRRETRLWPLLVVCGLSAAAFGFVYGEVFGFEHLIPTLWVRPLEQPLLVLLVPLIAGALILNLGILLHLVQTCWSGEGRSKGVADTAQLLVYWGLPLAFVDLRLGWLAVAGVALCLLNRLWHERSLLAALAGLGVLVQSTFELLLNTLSFVRVGAFALAHAALEGAIVTVAAGLETTAAAVLVLVAGNILVILLEGMVVMIQTTRLVLFEFFARFFEGSGRRFSPAGLPPAGGE